MASSGRKVGVGTAGASGTGAAWGAEGTAGGQAHWVAEFDFAVFIARLQPPHHAHICVIERALKLVGAHPAWRELLRD